MWNWFLGSTVFFLTKLQSLRWDKLEPIHDYDFDRLVQPPHSLQSLQLLTEECSPRSWGYAKIQPQESSPFGPWKSEVIKKRLSSIVRESALKSLHIQVRCGPRYHCGIKNCRTAAGYFQNSGFHSVKRINWICDWRWERPSPIMSYTVTHDEWDKDEVEHFMSHYPPRIPLVFHTGSEQQTQPVYNFAQ
ncbi:hypothetical protein TWF481_002766 [Arthrobotrys musiformis]|uniref:Uncharacterized protein n=1 Tax=Arthrobotrys musiformis TaxID=47236 RepID=A0AAV9VTA8_9PEZI